MAERRAASRLDALLVARGLAPTRVQARAFVLAGRVLSGSRRLAKPGQSVPADLPLALEAGPTWVGRGAIKLQQALVRLAVDPTGREALDVGASTGGFTELLLAAGARRVTALDVGRGQLDWRLRNDPRVVVLEGRNARYLRPADLVAPPELAVIDVSFISLKLVLGAVAACLTGDGRIVALVKPQFEAGRGRVGRGGIVREPGLHLEVLESLASFAAEAGLGPCDVCPSALRGRDGNQEFFLHLTPGRPAADRAELSARIARAVSAGPEAAP